VQDLSIFKISLVIFVKRNTKYTRCETVLLLYVLQKPRRRKLLICTERGPKRAMCSDTVGATEDRFGFRQLAVQSGNQRRTRTQDDGESPRDFACAIERLTHRAFLDDTKIKSIGEKTRNRRRGLKLKLRAGNKRTLKESLTKILGLKIRKMCDKTLWWALSRHKRKKGLLSLHARAIGVPATFEKSVPTN
jgi:hypothetical protein